MSTTSSNHRLSRSAAVVVKHSGIQAGSQASACAPIRKPGYLIGSGSSVLKSPNARCSLTYNHHLKPSSEKSANPSGDLPSNTNHDNQNPQSLISPLDFRISRKKANITVNVDCQTADTTECSPAIQEKRPSTKFIIKKESGKKKSSGTQPMKTSTNIQSDFIKRVKEIPLYFKIHPSERQKLDPRLLPSMKEGAKVLKRLHDDSMESSPPADQIRRSPVLDPIKPILVLDLDETLVHCCNFDGPDSDFESLMIYNNPTSGRPVGAKMNVRPFARQFLELVSNHYEVVAYTASESSYASEVCSLLDPRKVYFKKIFSRDDCFLTKKGFRVKDLRQVAGYNLSRTVLVDNSFHCFAPQISNGIPILPFTYEKDDRELMKLLDFLLVLKDEEDFPSYLQSYFNLRSFFNISSLQEIFKFLWCN